MGGQPIVPCAAKDLDPEKDPSRPGVDLVKQFSIGIMFRVHITQDGFQDSQVRDQPGRHFLGIKQQVQITDAVCIQIVVEDQGISGVFFRIIEFPRFPGDIFPFQKWNGLQSLLCFRRILVFF